MLQCSIIRIIGIKTVQSRFFVAVQQKTNNRGCLPGRAVRAASSLYIDTGAQVAQSRVLLPTPAYGVPHFTHFLENLV